MVWRLIRGYVVGHRRRWWRWRAETTALVCAAFASLSWAENPHASTLKISDPLDEVVVFGRGERLVGTAQAASEGTVGGADLSVRPLLRVAELLEVVPGLIAAQHSGSGKANQYFLRGMQLDHGTDFTAVIDGMPWNLRTHGHGQGYLDVNGLIPEVIDRIDYRKGPYRADVGDFSLAGTAILHTIDVLPHNLLSAESGSYGWGRVAAGATTSLFGGELTAVGQWKTYNGPWALQENLQHLSLWTKYRQSLASGTLAVTLSGYHATWHPSEQIPEASIGTAACANPFCSLDPTAFGITDRWIGTIRYFSERLEASGHLQRYDWHMLSNPTYDNQINQFDHRWTAGGKVERTLVQSARIQFKAGIEAQHDDIGHVGVDHAVAGIETAPVSDNGVRESSVAFYGEESWNASDRLRVSLGLRLDAYRFAVEAFNNLSVTGTRSARQASPKAGLAWHALPTVELYANWGRGYHSNDARGTVNRDTPVPGLVPGTGYEAGARFERGSLRLTATAWWLDVASELIFVGDSNAVEPRGGARRRGVELVSFWRLWKSIGIDAVYAVSRASYKQNQPDPDYDPVNAPTLQGTYVEGSVRSAGELGLSSVGPHWETSVRMRYLGPYPLVPSGLHQAGAETMVNLRTAWKHGRWSVYGELLNALGERGKDIVYYYPSYIPGVLAPGSEEVTRMSRAEEPPTLRMGAKREF
jgi:outer membrane receptor protein involved in Fe transport